ELKFAGIISSFQERQTKTGKPFGKFVLEDFVSSYEFVLFGDDYVQFRKYLGQDFFLYCVGKVITPRWKTNGEPEIKFQKMELLSEIRDKMTKKINLKLDVQNINNKLIDKLDGILNQSKGNCQVTLTAFDSKEKLISEMVVKRNGVRLTN